MRSLLCVGVLALLQTYPCAAQRSSRVSFDFSLGAGFVGSSAPHGSIVGLSVDALMGYSPGSDGGGGFIVAMSGSGQVLGVYQESCDAVPGMDCRSDLPPFWILSGLAGWESRNGVVRLLAGPAAAHAESKWVGAAQARLDLAAPVTSRFSLLASGRLYYIPDFRGDSFQLGSVGVGFRIR